MFLTGGSEKFEIPDALVDEIFGENDLGDSQFLTLESLEQVEGALATWNVDSSQLDAPWKSDYPL